MSLDLVLGNLLNPPILFFFLGAIAALVRSDLEIPQSIAKFLSLYLLLSIGFRGGVELRHSGAGSDVVILLLAAIAMAVIIPTISFFVLRLRLRIEDSAAIAATYGSISAVTFITATSFLTNQEIPWSGHLVAAMALMESPAIIVGVALAQITRGRETDDDAEFSWGELIRDAFLNGSVVLLLGSLVIGMLTGDAGALAIAPLTEDLFKGLLAFFLLDLGLVAARRIGDLRRSGAFLVGFSIVTPLVSAAAATAVAALLGLSEGDALLFVILCASASYIAVPAAIRIAIPSANPSLYVSMALGLTFPFNIVIGIPLYMAIIRFFWS